MTDTTTATRPYFSLSTTRTFGTNENPRLWLDHRFDRANTSPFLDRAAEKSRHVFEFNQRHHFRDTFAAPIVRIRARFAPPLSAAPTNTTSC